MSSFGEDCESLFGSRDLYVLLGLPAEKSGRKKLSAAAIKKAYYKASLRWHPDRNDSEEATKRFQCISKAYTVLANAEARKLYDETGVVESEEENFGAGVSDWTEVWRSLFKPITEEDIEAFKRDYKDSAEERRDIAKAYEASGGKMAAILDEIYMANALDDEERVAGIVRELIEAGELEDLPAFSKESAKAKARRRKAAAKEATEAAEFLAEIKSKEAGASGNAESGGLHALISARQAKRAADAGNFLDALAEKYSPKPKAKKTSKKKAK